MFCFSVLPLLLAALTFFNGVASAPLVARQIGDLQCNINRLQIVTDLAKTVSAVNGLSNAGKSDPAVVSAASSAQDGLTSAQQGIAEIAVAILTGQDAPAAARDQVEQGLTDADTALSGINSTDTAVTSALTSAQSELSKAKTAGEGVLANCK